MKNAVLMHELQGFECLINPKFGLFSGKYFFRFSMASYKFSSINSKTKAKRPVVSSLYNSKL